ncbi:MAG: N-acetylglucosamine-6-phosphate deacetylase [Bacteroidota bacterium]
MTAYTNARIFTGKEWIENGTVVCAAGRIVSVGTGVIPPNSELLDCKGKWLIPALLDLQIYGLGGKLLSAYPEADSLRVLAAENKKAGVVSCLATIATQPLDVIYKSIKAIKDYWEEGGTGILGMHLEGPFLNPVKRGAHKSEWIHSPGEKEVADLLEAGRDIIKVVTVAPELCPPSILRQFTDAGIRLSAGHCNAGYETAMRFSGLGIKLVTHLFNAMSPLHHRDTGLPGAVFQDNHLRASIIPDGIHVSFSALAIAKKQMGERLFYITDSVTETNIGPYQHQLNNDHYCTKDGTLSGSAITLLQGVKNGVEKAGISLEESIRMASLYPAQVMAIDREFGTIEEGKSSAMLLVTNQLELVSSEW